MFTNLTYSSHKEDVANGLAGWQGVLQEMLFRRWNTIQEDQFEYYLYESESLSDPKTLQSTMRQDFKTIESCHGVKSFAPLSYELQSENTAFILQVLPEMCVCTSLSDDVPLSYNA